MKGDLTPLTAREREILAAHARGLSRPEIADALFISPATVGRHIGNLREKLGIKNVHELIVYATKWAMQAGLIEG